LFNPTSKSVLLHKRDHKTAVNPNKWAFFGGLNEGAESPEECYRRELREEIGLNVAPENVHLLTEYMNKDLQTYRIVFYSVNESARKEFVLGEGASFDWVCLSDVNSFDLTCKTKIDLALFVTRVLGR
jgi:8-oxo-dGTP diphosphatase